MLLGIRKLLNARYYSTDARHCLASNQHIVDGGVHYFTSGTAENNNPSTNHSDFQERSDSAGEVMHCQRPPQ
jgi:hypothetical protein